MNQQTTDYDRTLGHLLSCQTQNDPDKWRKPALSEEKKILSDEDIRNFIIKVEDSLDLPLGILSQPGKGTVKGHQIPAVKQAVIYHLTQTAKVSKTTLAPLFGIKRENVTYHVREAEKHLATQDALFQGYYSLIQDIAV
jgi:hypothetical protein